LRGTVQVIMALHFGLLTNVFCELPIEAYRCNRSVFEEDLLFGFPADSAWSSTVIDGVIQFVACNRWCSAVNAYCVPGLTVAHAGWQFNCKLSTLLVSVSLHVSVAFHHVANLPSSLSLNLSRMIPQLRIACLQAALRACP
jgi:hypothetical protein